MAGFLSKLKEKVSGTGSEVVHEAEEEEGDEMRRSGGEEMRRSWKEGGRLKEE